MIFDVKVITNAKKQKAIKESESRLKVYIVSVPEKGRANKELVKYLAEYFKTSKSKINIIKGIKNKNKVIEIK